MKRNTLIHTRAILFVSEENKIHFLIMTAKGAVEVRSTSLVNFGDPRASRR